ncbi:MAG: hypothetical protein V4531_13755 [Actinomycetota bacterium]
MRRLQHFSGVNHRTGRPPKRTGLGRLGRLALTSVVAAVMGVFLVGQPALADGGQSASEGYVIVQQALSYLVNDPGKSGTTEALMKVKEALAAKDQDGVDVSTLEEAGAALKAGDAAAGRTLLQDSITEAVTALKPAIGVQTGTTTMLAPLPPRGALTPVDWILLGLSVIFAAIGVALASMLRPRESLRQLGLDIEAADARLAHSSPAAPNGRN